MNLTTKTIFLTLVLVFFGSVGVAQTSTTPASSNAEKDRLDAAYKKAESELTTCNSQVVNGQRKDCKTEIEAKDKALELLNAHNRTLLNKSEVCTEAINSINKITDKFDASAQEEALTCMEAGVGSSPEDTLDLTGAVLRSLSGQRTERQSICSVESAKSSQAEILKEKITALERLEKNLETLESRITDREKDVAKELANLNEDRMKLKEDWEKKQTDQEEQQAKDVAAVRESQIKIQEAIRKASAELINARQEYAKAKRNRSAALLKEGVHSFSSMERICRGQVKKYFSEAGYNTKKRANSLAAGARSGGSKVGDVNAFFEECLTAMNDKRKAIYEDAADFEMQKANELKNRQEAIATLENEYKQVSVSYNQALERASANMTKAQQNYFQNDSNLAMKISQLQIVYEKERQNLENQKQLLLQKIQAAELSNGKIKEREVTEGVNKMEAYMDSVETLFANGCPQAERFKADKSKFDSNRKRIQDVKALQ